MQNSTSDLTNLSARIEKLERQNRLFKRGGLALLLLPLALIVMGQARPSDTLEAHNFVLRDSGGTKRAELTMAKEDAVLRFFDSKGLQTSVVSDGLIFLVDPQHTKNLAPSVGGYVMLSVGSGEPDITVQDTQGFSAVLGVTDTVTSLTGEHHESSAASLKLLGPGKNANVLWSAP
jgi:hypothetical protein